MKLQIKYYGDSILRERCSVVTEITEEIRLFIANMIETMDALNGVGLAANQVGELYKILVIRPEEKTPNGEFVLGPAEVYINPVLSTPSNETNIMTEGCLSFPGLHVEIERPNSIHVEALDLNGNQISFNAFGFKAREIMHENDHLNGRFFIDRLSPDLRISINPVLRKIKNKYRNK